MSSAILQHKADPASQGVPCALARIIEELNAASQLEVTASTGAVYCSVMSKVGPSKMQGKGLARDTRCRQ